LFHLVSAAVCLFVVWRLVWPRPWSLGARVATALALALVAEHQLITRNFFGSMSSPEIPGALLMLLGWLFCGQLLLAMLLLLRDIAALAARMLQRRGLQAALTGTRVSAGLAAAALLLSAVGIWQAVRVPDVRTVEITLPNLPRSLDGFRIAQLTDLHASRLLQERWMEAVVARTNALNADLVVITGDLIDGTVAARVRDVAPLRKLRSPNGVFAIVGNHEYYVDYPGWVPAFRALGLQLLLNQHQTLRLGDDAIVLAGITDVAAAAKRQGWPDLRAALAGAPAGPPVILLSHRPVGAVRHAARGVDLQLSGHTHGGQILGPHLLTRMANEGFVSGLYQVGTMQLYVSNGAGLWAGFPIRLGVPSEITEIVLRAAAG